MEGKNQGGVLKESDYDSAHVLSPILTNANNSEASKNKNGKKKNKKKMKKSKKEKQDEGGDGGKNNDEEEVEELQEEARMEGGFDSASVSSPILTNAKNSEASIKKTRRKCKKKDEKIEKVKEKKRIKRIFGRYEWRKGSRRCKGMITGVPNRAKYDTAAAKKGARIRRRANRRRRRGRIPSIKPRRSSDADVTRSTGCYA